MHSVQERFLNSENVSFVPFLICLSYLFFFFYQLLHPLFFSSDSSVISFNFQFSTVAAFLLISLKLLGCFLHLLQEECLWERLFRIRCSLPTSRVNWLKRGKPTFQGHLRPRPQGTDESYKPHACSIFLYALPRNSWANWQIFLKVGKKFKPLKYARYFLHPAALIMWTSEVGH
jgi:hypothetical protein